VKILGGSDEKPATTKHHFSDGPAELVDLYPTLCKLGEAESPAGLSGEDLLSPSLQNGDIL
jgi:hypothetical protein